MEKLLTTNKLSRRDFIQNSATAALGAGLLAGTAPVFSAPDLSNAKASLAIKPQQKALVFIMLDGGNDSFNMLVPTSSSDYRDYRNSRSNLALNKNQLLPLDNYQDDQGRKFALHESMPEVQQLFARKKLAFMANIAPMIEPVKKADFYSGAARLPVGLLSHSDQFKHWQTSRPGERLNQGWFGYFADSLQANRKLADIPMNVSLSGSNIMQNGVQSSSYVINEQGSVGLVVNEEKNALNTTLENSFENLLNADYPGDPFKQAYLSSTRQAQAQHEVFRDAVADIRVPGHFSDTPLSQQLKMVAQTIKAADRLKTPQQTFFIRYIGWDHHDELLNNHSRMLRVVSQALAEFQQALSQLEIAERVVTFTGSDFGRTLTSNGNGTDHGWGGNTLVMGEAVNGGQIFGQYPSLKLGEKNPLDAGDGVIIPTTPTDQLYAELALWFGVDEKALPELFPNLPNFYSNGKFRSMGIVSA